MLVGSVVGKVSWRKVSSLERLDLQLDLLRSSWEPLREGLEGEELTKREP